MRIADLRILVTRINAELVLQDCFVYVAPQFESHYKNYITYVQLQVTNENTWSILLQDYTTIQDPEVYVVDDIETPVDTRLYVGSKNNFVPGMKIPDYDAANNNNIRNRVSQLEYDFINL